MIGILTTIVIIDPGGNDEVEGSVVARVNGEAILEAEYEQNVQQMMMQYQQMGIDFNTEQGQMMLQQIRAQALESLIRNVVLKQAAEDAGYEASDDAIDEQVQTLVDTQFGGNEAEFESALAQANMTRSDYEETVAEQIVVESYLEAEIDPEPVTEEAVEAAYDQYVDQLEQQDQDPEPFEEIKPQLTEQVKQQNMQQAEQAHVDELIESSDIERKQQ